MPRHRLSPLSLSLLTLGLLTMPFAGATAFAQATQQSTTDWKQGAWGHLSGAIGTYDYDLVLKDPAVSAKITAMMGEKEKDHLFKNLDVRNSIGFDRDCLVLAGLGEKGGGFEEAYLNVCLYAGTINAAILSNGKVTIYSDTDTYSYLPATLRQWVYSTESGNTLEKQPSYVVMKPTAK